MTKGPFMIGITLENDDQEDVFVSVTDLNLAGSPVILKKQRLDSGDSLPISVQEDGRGSGRIIWEAQRADDASQTARRTVTVEAGDTVDVTTQFS